MNRNGNMRPGRNTIARRQSGLTMISWIVIIIIAGILVWAAFRLVPAYIESAQVGSALSSIKKPARTASLGELRTKLASQITMNSIHDVQVDDFKFKLNGNQLTISVDVPIRRSFIGNLGFVVQCQHSITVTRTGG